MGPFELLDYVGLDTTSFITHGWAEDYPVRRSTEPRKRGRGVEEGRRERDRGKTWRAERSRIPAQRSDSGARVQPHTARAKEKDGKEKREKTRGRRRASGGSDRKGSSVLASPVDWACVMSPAARHPTPTASVALSPRPRERVPCPRQAKGASPCRRLPGLASGRAAVQARGHHRGEGRCRRAGRQERQGLPRLQQEVKRARSARGARPTLSFSWPQRCREKEVRSSEAV